MVEGNCLKPNADFDFQVGNPLGTLAITGNYLDDADGSFPAQWQSENFVGEPCPPPLPTTTLPGIALLVAALVGASALAIRRAT